MQIIPLIQTEVQKCRVQTTIIRIAMSEYRFHLQKYSYGSKISCPNCGKSRCFVRYVDEEGIIRFPDTVGKCDHENSCGYHYTPREYFHDHPDVSQVRSQGLQKPSLPIALLITVGILYTATCAESSVKRRRQDFSAFIKSGLPTNGADPRSTGKQTYPER